MLRSGVVSPRTIMHMSQADVLGKYFEVRYFLNVVVGSAHTSVVAPFLPIKLTPLRRLVTVQLPIVLIHMVRPMISLYNIHAPN